MMIGFQNVCKKLGQEVNKSLDDVYPIFPMLGEHKMMQRMNPYDGFEGSCKHQMLLDFCLGGMSPEVDSAVVASSILVGNSLFHNPKRSEVQQKALEGIYDGTQIGGIGITGIESGSVAVNMTTTTKINDSDGSVTYNGSKIYTTNGPVADILTTYAVTDISNPRRTMVLTLFKPDEDEGITRDRLHIPAGHGIGYAKVDYNNTTVPADRLIAPPGEGYKRLFRGLTPERIAIIGGVLGGIWNALAHGVIYSQLRHQFGNPLLKYQGISHVLSDIYAQASALTAFAIQIADFYDSKVGIKIHKGEKPSAIDEGTVAIMAAQGKYLTAKLSHTASYEIVQTMGGRGAISEPGSNNIINRLENVARLSEVVGGHRNIQLMIIEAGLRGTTEMALGSHISKSKRQARKKKEKLTSLVISRAEKLLNEDSGYLSEGTKGKLSSAFEINISN